MNSKVKKLINLSGAYCVILPKAYCELLDWHFRDKMKITLRDNDVLISKIKQGVSNGVANTR